MQDYALLACVDFDYQGKHYALKSLIKLETALQHENFFHSIYLNLAQENNIGLYSYELEVLMDQPIIFSSEIGYVKECIIDGELDLMKLKKVCQQLKDKQLIAKIAQQYFSPSALTDNILDALTAAYLLGKSK